MGIRARGATIKAGDGNQSNHTAIAEVVTIGGPELSADTADTTHHNSTDGFEEVVTTIKRTGEVSLECNYLPTDSTQDAADGLINYYKNDDKREYKLVFPNSSNTTWTFDAYVTGVNPDAPVDGKLGIEFTLKITGKPTLN